MGKKIYIDQVNATYKPASLVEFMGNPLIEALESDCSPMEYAKKIIGTTSL